MLLRLYTDFVCPFCFIAEESTVPRLVRELGLELEWHGFELHPRTPPGGLPLSRLFPGRDLASMHEGTRRFAAEFGVTNFSPPNTLYNTRRALAVAEYARDSEKLLAFKRAAFDANFRHGKNLESDADLREIAASVGLDPERALEASRDPLYLGRVDERQAEARHEGISGIPTFLIGKERVVGCQPYEVLLAAAKRALG
ncbi:MAG TPA: DsbA family protein [Polyangiaceae bacterium]|nr:DsbA family protein [Polyangiaceae bacterium]